MTNEIKEILKRFNEFLKGGNYTVLIMNLTKNEVKTLLDYINNLQEENENLKDFNKKLQATKDRLGRLECEINEEIERLNKRLEEDKGKPCIDNTKITMLETLEIILDRIKN